MTGPSSLALAILCPRARARILWARGRRRPSRSRDAAARCWQANAYYCARKEFGHQACCRGPLATGDRVSGEGARSRPARPATSRIGLYSALLWSWCRNVHGVEWRTTTRSRFWRCCACDSVSLAGRPWRGSCAASSCMCSRSHDGHANVLELTVANLGNVTEWAVRSASLEGEERSSVAAAKSSNCARERAESSPFVTACSGCTAGSTARVVIPATAGRLPRRTGSGYDGKPSRVRGKLWQNLSVEKGSAGGSELELRSAAEPVAVLQPIAGKTTPCDCRPRRLDPAWRGNLADLPPPARMRSTAGFLALFLGRVA